MRLSWLAISLSLSLSLSTIAGHASAHPARDTALQDLTGVRILHSTYDNFAGVPTTFLADLTARGAVVDALDYRINPYPLLHAGYDILILHAIGYVPIGQDLQSLLAWVRSGGKSILFEGVNFSSIGTANVLSDSLGAGWRCRPISSGRELVTDILVHPVTNEVHSLDNLTGYYTHFSAVEHPAGALFRRPQGEVVGAYSALDDARMAYIGISLLWNDRIVRADNRLLANQAIDWLAEIGGTVAIEATTWSGIKSMYRR